MPIEITLDVMLVRRKMRGRTLAARIGVREQHLSNLKRGRLRGIRLDTLDRICAALDCQPGDLLEYRPAAAPAMTRHEAATAVDA